MKQTVYLDTFRNAFQEIRPNNFSHAGLSVLFEYFEEFEDSTGEEIELDVIAVCCEYSEQPWQEVAESYDIDLSQCDDDEERISAIQDYINDHSQYCGITEDGSIVYLQF